MQTKLTVKSGGGWGGKAQPNESPNEPLAKHLHFHGTVQRRQLTLTESGALHLMLMKRPASICYRQRVRQFLHRLAELGRMSTWHWRHRHLH